MNHAHLVIIESSIGTTHQFSFFSNLASAEQAACVNSPDFKKIFPIITIEDLNEEIKILSVKTISKNLKVYETGTSIVGYLNHLSLSGRKQI